MRMVWVHWCNLAGKGSGLECAGVNNDDFTVLVSGGSRCPWVSACTVWLSHSKWLSEWSNESASDFALSLNTCLRKLLGGFGRPQLWATGDGQLHHNKVPTHASHLVKSFLVKHQITQVTQPSYSPGLVPCDFWLFPKLNSLLKRNRFQIISDIQENMTGQTDDDWENCVRSQGAYLEGAGVSLSYVQCFLYFVQ